LGVESKGFQATLTELQVLNLYINESMPLKQVARTMNISPHTLKNHLTSMKNKNFGENGGNITSLVVSAERAGLLDPDFWQKLQTVLTGVTDERGALRLTRQRPRCRADNQVMLLA
jgi:DNA-binding CsgD family transcriptional regulator